MEMGWLGVEVGVGEGVGWMCGDLVSNHGTTGRASIERAEARPSYPIPSPFAWSHVGGTSGTGGTGANQPNPMLLSHALSYSSSRKSLSFHLLLSLPFSLSSSLSLSLFLPLLWVSSLMLYSLSLSLLRLHLHVSTNRLRHPL